MKHTASLFFAMALLLSLPSCSDKTDDNNDGIDVIASKEISEEGGRVEVTDEAGNVISIYFPPGALSDTVDITINIFAENKQYPMEKLNAPAFRIGPEDINLYKPVEITIKFQDHISGIENNLLFRVRSDSWLTPLSDQNFSLDNNSLTATTLFFGEFAEGEMSLEQLNTQINLLSSSLDITWKSYSPNSKILNNPSCDSRIHKALWDEWKDIAGSFITFFYQRYMLGYYNNLEPGQHTYEEERALICSNVIDKGAQLVLDQCIPDDLCDRDYTHTIVDMMYEMNLLGCEGSEVFNKVNSRFNNMLIDCSSYLTINSFLNIESGGFTVETTGVVPLHLSRSGSGIIDVTGAGTLLVMGDANAEGSCTGVVSGTTEASVIGVRDAMYNYTLSIALEQNAFLTVTCPDGGPFVTPLVGGSSKEVVLSKNNNFSVTIEEDVDGGTFTLEVTLDNPYTSLPDGLN